jgi:hypothetical protein
MILTNVLSGYSLCSAETAETTFPQSRETPISKPWPWRFGEMHEAYQPIIDDGRGRFPEDLRLKAPSGARAAIAAAAELKNTSHSEYVPSISTRLRTFQRSAGDQQGDLAALRHGWGFRRKT